MKIEQKLTSLALTGSVFVLFFILFPSTVLAEPVIDTIDGWVIHCS